MVEIVSPSPKEISVGKRHVEEEFATSPNVSNDGVVGAINMNSSGNGVGWHVSRGGDNTSLKNDMLNNGVGYDDLDQNNGPIGSNFESGKGEGPKVLDQVKKKIKMTVFPKQVILRYRDIGF